MEKEAVKIRDSLISELKDRRVFWSYDDPDPGKLTDDTLIEKVLVHADLESIRKLFLLYPESRIRKVWELRVLPDERLSSMNKLFAYLLFHIPDPDRYLESAIRNRHNDLTA